MTFRVGVTRDLRTVDGEPCFGRRAFDVLEANADIEWEWLSEDPKEVTPEIAARYDGLHLNLPRVTSASLARSDCRLKVIARHGVGFDALVLTRQSPMATLRSPVSTSCE